MVLATILELLVSELRLEEVAFVSSSSTVVVSSQHASDIDIETVELPLSDASRSASEPPKRRCSVSTLIAAAPPAA